MVLVNQGTNALEAALIKSLNIKNFKQKGDADANLKDKSY